MYTPNLERNKLVYELWEKGLPVNRISSLTGIPRSTVGYYVRKFNKLAAEGKPVVFPAGYKTPREASTKKSPMQEMLEAIIGMKAFQKMRDGGAEDLYYILMDFKLLEEFGWLPEEL